MSPKTNPKSIQIMIDLNNLSYIERHNFFVLNQYKIDVKKFIDNLPGHAFEILGVISTLEKNLSDLHYYHNLSVSYGRDRAENYFNYAISLMKLGFISESLEKANKSFEFNNLYRNNNNIMIKHNFCIGDFSSAIKYLNHWNGLYPDAIHNKTEIITNAFDILKHSNISQDELIHFIDGILKIFQSENIYLQDCDFEVVVKEDKRSLKFKYLIDLEYEPLLDIEDKVYEYMLLAPQKIQNLIMVDLDTEDPRLEEFLTHFNNYERENPECYKKVDPVKMDRIAKLIQA